MRFTVAVIALGCAAFAVHDADAFLTAKKAQSTFRQHGNDEDDIDQHSSTRCKATKPPPRRRKGGPSKYGRAEHGEESNNRLSPPARPEQQSAMITRRNSSTLSFSLDPLTRTAPIPSPSSSPSFAAPESERKEQYERRLQQVQSQPYQPKSMEEYDLQQLIVYEDDHLVAVNKPSGILSVPDMKGNSNMLDAVWQNCGTHLDSPSMMLVHRLDCDTSGIILFGKTMEATRSLDGQFRSGNIKRKVYEALLCGRIIDSAASEGFEIEIDLPLQRDASHPPFTCVSTQQSFRDGQLLAAELAAAGYKKQFKKYGSKDSRTSLRVIDSSMDAEVTRVSLIPHTGRNHQLRVHCAAIGFPIVGDTMYGGQNEFAPKNGGMNDMEWQSNDESMQWPQALQSSVKTDAPKCDSFNRLCLHAKSIELLHPATNSEIKFEAPPGF